MNEWNGRGVPSIPIGATVRLRFRNGSEGTHTYGRGFLSPDWTHNDSPGDIVAYEVVDPRKEFLPLPVADHEFKRPVLTFPNRPVVPTTDAVFDGNSDANGEGKQTNPKDLVGSKKVPLSTLPFRVLWRVGLAMLEGMCKYGRHNYRAAGVRGSVYFDSTMRHLGSWWEGENDDPDSGFHHIDKAIAGLMVLRDSMLAGSWTDDRPPSMREDFKVLDKEASRIVDAHKDKKVRHFTIADTKGIS